MMSEDTGWPPEEADETQAEVQPEPDAEAPAEPEEATPLPGENADPQQVADEVAAAEPDTAIPPRPLPDPDWLLDLRNRGDGVLLTFAEDVQRRLRNAGW